VGRGPCPVVALLLARVEALELMCAPKGVGPSAVVDFSCKAALSEGVAMGAARPIMDPPAAGPAPSRERGVVGEGHAPVVWQYSRV
jgi:hypothetical protein